MDDLLLEFGGYYYYLDFEALDEFLRNDEETPKKVEETEIFEKYDEKDKPFQKTILTRSSINEKEINGIRYEMVGNMLDAIFSNVEGGDGDDLLGGKRALSDAPLSYKLAINTLIKYNILKQIKNGK